MRRLPLFFVIDVSESMAGEKLAQMQEGMKTLLRFLRQDPQALETVHVAFIAFAGIAKVLHPLHEVFAAIAPDLPMGSGTALGEALTLLMNEIDKSVKKNTPEMKGDYKPVIYLMTDGRPTDSVEGPIQRWVANYARHTEIVSIAYGNGADLSVLNRLGGKTFVFSQTDPADFTKFIQWISQSVSMQSAPIDGAESRLAPIDFDILKPAVNEKPQGLTDDSCVVLIGRCQQNRKPYLVKYEKEAEHYVASGAYPLQDSYFEWSAGSGNAEPKINVGRLLGVPPCPYCSNPYSIANCACGKLFCCAAGGVVTCPWCQQSVQLVSGEGDYEVSRGRG